MSRSILAFLVAFATTAGAQQPVDLGARADEVFAQWNKSSPGCAVGVSFLGRTVFARGYGMADLETGTAITPETIFESGSVAKQFTATAILLLMHDGKLRMDDPVQKFIPELPTYDRTITIRHLVSHTSGLREWSNLVAAAGWPRGSRTHTQDDLLGYVFAQKELNYPVGDYYSYTNSGFALLQTIVERASGMSFQRFSDERIFKPLGMTKTSWRDDFTRIVPGRAQAYERRGQEWHLDMPFESVVGPGGLLTTVGDWLTWNDALDNRKLGAWHVDSLESQATLTSGRKIAYAMGVTVGTFQGQRTVAHSGSTGGYSTYLLRLPERRISVAVLCNASGAPATNFARQMASALLPPVSGSNGNARPDTVAIDAAVAARITGIYRSSRTHEALPVGVGGGRGGRSAGTIRKLRDGTFLIGNSRVIIQLEPSGPPRGLLRLGADNDTIPFVYVGATPWTPSLSDLSAFVGRYSSDEVGATWTATIADGRLVLGTRHGEQRTLTPAYADAFSGGGLGTVWFSRDGGGRVTAMHFSSGRLWDLALPRLP